MLCPNCKENCADDAAFCKNCGTKLSGIYQPLDNPVVENTPPTFNHDSIISENSFGYDNQNNHFNDLPSYEPSDSSAAPTSFLSPEQSTFDAQQQFPESTPANENQAASGYQPQFGNFAENTTDDFYGNYVPPKKKKSKKALAVVLSVLIVISGLAVIFRGFTVNLFRNLFYSNEKYMAAVINDDIKKYSKDFTENYGRAINKKDSQGKADLNIKLSKRGAAIINDLTGADVSNFKDVSLSMESALKGDSIYSGASLKVNGKKFTSGKVVIDDGDPYLQCDLLGKDFYDFSSSMPNEVPNSFSSISEIRNIFPSEKALNKIITRYAKIATSKFEDVDKSKETVEFGDLSIKTTELTSKIDGELAYNVVTAILEEAEDDKDIKKIITDIVESDALSDAINEDADDIIDEYENGIEDVLDELDKDDFDAVDDIDCEFTVNVDSFGNIVCRKVTIENVTVSIYSIDKSGKFAYGLEIKSGKEKASVVATGKTSSHKYTGDLRVKYGETSFKVASFEKVDFHKIADGKCSGKIIISGGDLPLDLLSSVLDDEYLDYLENGEIIFDFDLSPDKASLLLDITYNGDSLLMIKLDSDESKVKIPDVDDALDPDDIDDDVLEEAEEKTEEFFGDIF